MFSKKIFIISILISSLNFSNVSAYEKGIKMTPDNFINQIIALNDKDSFSISNLDRFKFFYLLWEIPKEIKPQYNSAVTDILRVHNILPNNLDEELEIIWKDVCQKVERKYMFIMWINGPIEMSIEQWRGYKRSILAYVRRLYQKTSTNL